MKKRIFINWLREIFCPKTIKKESEDSKEIRMKKSISYSQNKGKLFPGIKNNKSYSSRKK